MICPRSSTTSAVAATAPAMMTSPMVPVIRSSIDMITSWKDIAATPALIA